jgi:hypothetical protein
MKQIVKLHPIFTLMASLAIWSLLAWNYFNGGVSSHNILAKADMPSISNWWGAVLIPILSWYLVGKTKKRITAEKSFDKIPNSVYFGFFGGLFIGIILAISVETNLKIISSNMIYVLLGISVFYPIYRAECILGFILGMCYSIGAVLPTGFAVVMASTGFVIHFISNRLRSILATILQK